MTDTGAGERAEEVIPYSDIPPAFINFVALAQKSYQRRMALASARAERSEDTWISRSGDELSYELVVGDVRQEEAAFSAQNFTLAIADIPYGFNVDGSENDDVRFELQDILEMVESFKRRTSAPNWRFVVVHSQQQTSFVMEALDQVCNAGIDGGIWDKPNINHCPPGNRMAWGFEAWTVGFHSTRGTGRDGMYIWEPQESKLNIIKNVPCVTKKSVDLLGTVVNPYQKPVALNSWFVNHFSNEGDWVADLCCGTGAALVAALLANRNGAAVDKSKRQIEFVKQRIMTLNPEFWLKDEWSVYADGVQGLEVQPLSEDGTATMISTHEFLMKEETREEKADEEEDSEDSSDSEREDLDTSVPDKPQPAQPGAEFVEMDNLLME